MFQPGADELSLLAVQRFERAMQEELQTRGKLVGGLLTPTQQQSP